MQLEFIKPSYSAVKSVNGQVGDVKLNAKDVGAATEAYVDMAVSNVDVDLTGYATEAYVDKKVAEAATGGTIDLEAYATKEYVIQAIGEIPQPDMSEYATIKNLEDAIENIALTPGPKGEPGKDGQDGYTPVKGVDYFDGLPGEPGEDGKDYVLTEDDKAEIASMVPGADVDLTNYYTKEEIDSLLANMPAGDIPSGEEVEF